MALKSILVKPKQSVNFRNPLECNICKERFYMTSKYLEHMASHRNFLLSCNICNKGFYDQKQLDKHYLIHNEVINTYDCFECPKKFLQKYQLEQHMHFHSVTSNEPAAKKRKSVHFSNILESRNIEDFSDNEESFSDDDFSEDYNPVNKTTTTRSGRVVKPKKLFENEQKVKRKYDKKSKESHTESSVNAKEDIEPTMIQNSNAETIKVNVNAEEAIHPIEPAMIQNSNALIINKELRIISHKIPDALFKEYIANGNVCSYETPNSSKCDPEHVQSSSSKLLPIDIGNNEDKISRSFSVGKNHVQPTQVFKSSGITINPNNSELPKKLKEKTKTNAITLNINSSNNFITITSPPHSEQCNKTINNESNIVSSDKSKLPKKSKGNCKSVELSPATKTAFHALNVSPSKRPQVGNGFVYVGTKPDINRITRVIDVVRAADMSKDKSPSLKASAQVGSKTSSTISVRTSPGKHQSNTVYKKNQQNKRSVISKNNLNGNLPGPEEDDILDKKMVQEFLVIKVTQEYMQKMQEQKSKSATECIYSNNASPATSTSQNNKAKKFLVASETISPKVNDTSLTSNVSASDEPPTVDVEASEMPSSNTGIQRNLDASQAFSPNVNVSSESCAADDIKMLENRCNDIASKKSKLTELNKKGKQMMPDELGCLNASQELKLRQLIKAKLEEKERKKKEKYELKKKMRYAEKILSLEVKRCEMNGKKKSSSKFSKKKVKDMKIMTVFKKNRKSVEHMRKKEVDSLKKSNKPRLSSEDSYSNASTDKNDDKVSKKSNGRQSESDELAEKAIEAARDISEKFNKKLSEAEHLKLLRKLDDLVKIFNIGGKCEFLSPIVRFCRLYVDSYKVKKQALSLGEKIGIIKPK